MAVSDSRKFQGVCDGLGVVYAIITNWHAGEGVFGMNTTTYHHDVLNIDFSIKLNLHVMIGKGRPPSARVWPQTTYRSCI